MALADPQSVTIGTTPGTVSLPRTGLDMSEGAFLSSDGNTKFTVSHQYGKRKRHLVRLDFQKVAPDPLISSTNVIYSASAYVVVDAPLTGFSISEQKDVLVALATYITAASAANAVKVLGGES